MGFRVSDRPAKADAPARRVLFVDGRYWRVYEHVAHLDRRSTPALIFESDDVMRRVRRFPADWHTLDDHALFAVSLGV